MPKHVRMSFNSLVKGSHEYTEKKSVDRWSEKATY